VKKKTAPEAPILREAGAVFLPRILLHHPSPDKQKGRPVRTAPVLVRAGRYSDCQSCPSCWPDNRLTRYFAPQTG
jgi:hypothetical protein